MAARTKSRPKSLRRSDTVRGHLYKWLDLDELEDAESDAPYPEQLRGAIPVGRASDRVTEAQRRLNLLFDGMGIPQGNFQELAIALACRYVPGFRLAEKLSSPPKKRGRPPKKKGSS